MGPVAMRKAHGYGTHPVRDMRDGLLRGGSVVAEFASMQTTKTPGGVNARATSTHGMGGTAYIACMALTDAGSDPECTDRG